MNSASMPQSAPASEADAEAEHLSAWFDGELDPGAAEPVLSGLMQQRPLRQRYQDWCMVSDALRSEEVLAGHSPRLGPRIAEALAHEPALLAPSSLRPQLRRHLASGFGVAAAAVVLALVAVPQLRNAGTGPGESPALVSSAQAPALAAALNLADPGATALAAAPAPHNPRLDPYLQAHRDFMSSGVMPAAAVYLRSSGEGDR